MGPVRILEAKILKTYRFKVPSLAPHPNSRHFGIVFDRDKVDIELAVGNSDA